MKKILINYILFIMSISWIIFIALASSAIFSAGPIKHGPSMLKPRGFYTVVSSYSIFNVTDNGGEAFVVTDSGGEDYRVAD